jgi:hypothetical protein
MFFMTLCSTATNNAQSNENEKENTASSNQTNSGTNNASANNIVYNPDIKYNSIWGVWGGGELGSDEITQYSFLKGWYVVYQWKKLEPQKDHFDWNYFDAK